MFKAEYYQKDDGSYPVEEFILSLEQEMTSILNCGRYSERK